MFRAHDPTMVPMIKEWTLSNSGFSSQMQRAHKLKQTEGGSVAIMSSTDYKEIADIKEVVRALDAMVTIIKLIRNYDYGPEAIRNTLASCNFLAGTYRRSWKCQKNAIENFINECIRRNNNNARIGKPPLTFKECSDELKTVIGLDGKPDTASLALGKVYMDCETFCGERHHNGDRGGPSGQNGSANNNARSSNGNNNTNTNGNRRGNSYRGSRGRGTRGRGGNNNRPQTPEEKAATCCRNWNLHDNCAHGQNCRYKHKCSTLIENNTRVCWGDHRSVDHI